MCTVNVNNDRTHKFWSISILDTYNLVRIRNNLTRTTYMYNNVRKRRSSSRYHHWHRKLIIDRHILQSICSQYARNLKCICRIFYNITYFTINNNLIHLFSREIMKRASNIQVQSCNPHLTFVASGISCRFLVLSCFLYVWNPVKVNLLAWISLWISHTRTEFRKIHSIRLRWFVWAHRG